MDRGKKRPRQAATDERRLQQLGARIPEEIYKRLGHFTVDHRRTIAEVVGEAIDEYLKKRGA